MTANESLSARIRRETAPDHRNAEGGDVMTRLLKGELPLSGYMELLVQMRALYAALEEQSRRHAGDARYGGFFDTALERTAVLADDVAAVEARVGGGSMVVLESTRSFVGRVLEVGGDPLLLLAHHYTRYMGDLSGGIMIGRAVDKAYGFDGGPGVTWFQFPALADVDGYKNAYRARLDGLGLEPDDADRLIAEVHRSYTLNGSILRELSAHHR